jgi:hypothetical protein
VTKPALIPIEGPEKATRGGVNGSQSKFLTGIWLMSQNQPKSTLFYPDQNRLAIDKLSAFETGLATVTETLRGANETTQETDNKNSTQKQFISSRVFHRTLGGHVRETAAGEQFRPQILETFDTVARGTTGDHLQTIYTR